MVAIVEERAYNCGMSSRQVSPDLKVPEFPFSSPLASHAMALERMRGDLPRTVGNLPVVVELGELYRLMSSIISARIEGNHTTVVEAVESARLRETKPRRDFNEGVQEILRLQDAADFIDTHIDVGTRITHSVVRELHRIATQGLRREGDPTPGEYRQVEVVIAHSDHVPPLAATVHSQMYDLLDFTNQQAEPHLQLIRMAIAHHRFVWIHPFTNGNGRVARLFSYAMMRSCGFAPSVEYQTVNPTTVFGADRQGYYDHLAAADSLTDSGLVSWAEFVLSGLRRDMEMIHDLTRKGVLERLVQASIAQARRAAQLTEDEADALTAVAHGNAFRAGDLVSAVGGSPTQRSLIIRGLLQRDLIRRLKDGGRVYRIRLSPNDLTPFVIGGLGRAGLLPSIMSD